MKARCYTFLLLFAMFLCCCGTTKAQHCPFDATTLIVVHAYEDGNAAVIPNLKITMLDSLGQDMGMEFWQNVADPLFRGYVDNNSGPNRLPKVRFPFAKDNYVRTCKQSAVFRNCMIRIEDMDGDENGGYFETTSMKVELIQTNRLCDVYRNETYPDLKVIDVALKRK